MQANLRLIWARVKSANIETNLSLETDNGVTENITTAVSSFRIDAAAGIFEYLMTLDYSSVSNDTERNKLCEAKIVFAVQFKAEGIDAATLEAAINTPAIANPALTIADPHLKHELISILRHFSINSSIPFRATVLDI